MPGSAARWTLSSERREADEQIPVIEDNAHGLFGKYKGRYLGTFGVLAAQSFHETKNFSSGEGGALIIMTTSFEIGPRSSGRKERTGLASSGARLTSTRGLTSDLVPALGYPGSLPLRPVGGKGADPVGPRDA